jgi:hypothetical protein
VVVVAEAVVGVALHHLLQGMVLGQLLLLQQQAAVERQVVRPLRQEEDVEGAEEVVVVAGAGEEGVGPHRPAMHLPQLWCRHQQQRWSNRRSSAK